MQIAQFAWRQKRGGLGDLVKTRRINNQYLSESPALFEALHCKGEKAPLLHLVANRLSEILQVMPRA